VSEKLTTTDTDALNQMGVSQYALDGLGSAELGQMSEQDALFRLQALLTDWLRMENVVVLVGSGCSCSAGGKVLLELECAVLDLIEKKYEATSEKGVKQLIAYRKENRGKGSFEEWLSYLSNAAYLLSQDSSPISELSWQSGGEISRKALDKLLENLTNAIFAYCALTLPQSKDSVPSHLVFLAKLMARDPSLGRVHLFTTNYDTLLEQALDALGAQYEDGFIGKVKPRFDPSCYGLDVYYPGEVSEGRVRRYDKFLHLYKLHGSIHWRFKEKDAQVYSEQVPLEKFKEWQTQSLNDQASHLNNLRSDDSKLIGILPTANKYVQTLELPYSHLFRSFSQRLQEPQTFFLVIGYGFGDDHINRIIDDAMLNPGLVLLVVDPNPGKTTKEKIQKYQQSGERAFLLRAQDFSRNGAAKFDDFVQNVLPHIKWLDQFIKLKKLEKTIKEVPPPQGAD